MTEPKRVSSGESAYLAITVGAGAITILVSLWQMASLPIGYGWFVLAALTILSGWATLRLPSVPVSFSISDTFTMTAALLFGPAAGTVAVAIDGLAICLRLARQRPLPLVRLLFNVAAPALAMWTAAHVFFALAKVGPLSARPDVIVDVLGALAVFAALYFLLNTGLIAVAVALERRAPIVSIWRQHFVGLWLTYFGGASIAALVILLVYSRRPDFKMLALVLPLPLILYATFKSAVDRLQENLAHLDTLNRMNLATVHTLAQAIDAKDQVTHGHIRRVQLYAVRLAHELGAIDEAEMRALEAAALLHDVGKLAIPEHILNKPAKLTDVEFEKMKQHAEMGAQILSSINFPFPVVPIVRHHHERWDGSGYPAGLKGTMIPIGARILSVVDCFDALTSDRPYRPRLSDAHALDVVREGRGTHYDPDIVDAFVRIYPRIAADIHGAASELPAFSTIADAAQIASAAATLPQGPREAAIINATFDLAATLDAGGDLDAMCERLRELLERVMPAATCALYLYDAPRDRLVARAVTGVHAAAIRGSMIRLGQRLTGWVAANRVPIVNSDAALDLGNLALALQPPPRTCLSVPMTAGSELVGTVTVYSVAPDPFTERDRQILEVVAGKLTAGLRAAREER